MFCLAKLNSRAVCATLLPRCLATGRSLAVGHCSDSPPLTAVVLRSEASGAIAFEGLRPS